MEELKFIGVENGYVTVTSEAGLQYQLPITEDLRAAVRTPISKVHHEQDLPRPRDVQTQLRSGATVEQVAAQYKVDTDYVLRFAAPVIAELEHTIDLAKAVILDQPETEEHEPVTFGMVVAEKLEAAESSSESWSSWKDQDRNWIVQVEYLLGEVSHDARWKFEPRRSQLTATNIDAEQLLGDEPLVPAHARPLRPVADLFAVTTEHASSPAATDATNDQPGQNEDTTPEAPRTPTSLAPVTAFPTATHSTQTKQSENYDATAKLLDELEQRRGEREPAPDLDSAVAEDDAIYDRDPSGPLSIAQVRSRMNNPDSSDVKHSGTKANTTDTEDEEPAANGPASTRTTSTQQGDESTDTEHNGQPALFEPVAEVAETTQDTESDGHATTQGPKTPRKRRAMPSWDEIVFGASHDSERSDADK